MSQASIEVPLATPPAAPPPAVAAPPVAATPAATPPAPAPPAPPPSLVAPATLPTVQAPQDGVQEPTWFKPRLEQAKRALLTTLGVKDEAEAKALIDRSKAIDDANKTELQKAKELADSLKAKADKADAYELTIKSRVEVELATLTEPQRAAVAKLAGDDPAKTLSAIDTLKPTWAAAAVPVTPTPATPAPVAPAPVPPATTSPPPNAPGGVTTSPPDRKAEYASLKKSNPIAAAHYLNAYSEEIYPRSR